MKPIEYMHLAQEVTEKYKNHLINTEEAILTLKEISPKFTDEIIEKLGITNKMYKVQVHNCCIVESLYFDDINEIINLYNSGKYKTIEVYVKLGNEWWDHIYLTEDNLHRLKLWKEAFRPFVNQDLKDNKENNNEN